MSDDENQVDPYDVHRACSRKTRYRTEERAGKVAALYSTLARPLHVYLCPYCQGFHITHHRRDSGSDKKTPPTT